MDRVTLYTLGMLSPILIIGHAAHPAPRVGKLLDTRLERLEPAFSDCIGLVSWLCRRFAACTRCLRTQYGTWRLSRSDHESFARHWLMDKAQVENRTLRRLQLSERQTTKDTPALMLYASSAVRASVSKHAPKKILPQNDTTNLIENRSPTRTKMTSDVVWLLFLGWQRMPTRALVAVTRCYFAAPRSISRPSAKRPRIVQSKPQPQKKPRGCHRLIPLTVKFSAWFSWHVRREVRPHLESTLHSANKDSKDAPHSLGCHLKRHIYAFFAYSIHTHFVSGNAYWPPCGHIQVNASL